MINLLKSLNNFRHRNDAKPGRFEELSLKTNYSQTPKLDTIVESFKGEDLVAALHTENPRNIFYDVEYAKRSSMDTAADVYIVSGNMEHLAELILRCKNSRKDIIKKCSQLGDSEFNNLTKYVFENENRAPISSVLLTDYINANANALNQNPGFLKILEDYYAPKSPIHTLKAAIELKNEDVISKIFIYVRDNIAYTRRPAELLEAINFRRAFIDVEKYVGLDDKIKAARNGQVEAYKIQKETMKTSLVHGLETLVPSKLKEIVFAKVSIIYLERGNYSLAVDYAIKSDNDETISVVAEKIKGLDKNLYAKEHAQIEKVASAQLI